MSVFFTFHKNSILFYYLVFPFALLKNPENDYVNMCHYKSLTTSLEMSLT